MPALDELQRRFAGAVRRGPVDPGVLAVKAAGLSTERRIAVYQNHHRISLVAALAANFPVTGKVIGTPAFEAFAAAFVAESPPTGPCLGAYGAGFAEFLDRDVRLRALPYIGDVARLDWAFNKAERADDVAAFGPADLESLVRTGLAEARLIPHPSLSLIRSRYPLLRIRDLALGADIPGVSLEEGSVALMIWRRDGVVECAALEDAAGRFIEALSAGAPLGAAAADLAPDQLAPMLARHVMAGAFAALGR